MATCRLVFVLGLHSSDLLVIAGQQVPNELAPPDPNVRDKLGWVAWPLAYLPRAATELYELVRSLPRLPRPAGPALSPSTIGMIGDGRKALTPDLLAGFGAVLDIASVDLSIVTGVDISAADERIHPDAGEAAELIWSARWLTAEQLRLVQDRARGIRRERAEELDPLQGQLHRTPITDRTPDDSA